MTELQDKIDYFNDLKAEQVQRPSSKEEYIALLENLQREIEDLIDAQNAEAELKRIEDIAATQALVSTPEYKWILIRNQRTQMLFQYDWTDLPNAPLSEEQKNTWQIYRQALRDITKQADPDNIVWPVPPE